MQYFDIYVGGKFTKTDNIIEVLNPFDNSIVGKTYLAGKNELEDSLLRAKKVKEEMKYLPVYKKYKILNEIASQLKDKKEEFAEIIATEACKPMKYAINEVERAIQSFIIASEESKRLPKEYFSLDWSFFGDNKEGLVKYFPVGIIAGIAPFNFPLNLAVHKIAPAIAAGCPIIIKPSRNTPLSVLKLSQLIDNTELPKGAFSVLPMDREAGNQLVTDERIALLTFTGSSEVGWKMKSNCGKKKVLLELGGNAGVLVSETADIDLAVNKCVTSAFAFSGQVCIHAQRIYVHSSVFNQFIDKFIDKTKMLKYGNPLNINTDISAMIDENNAIRIESWVNEAVNQGAKVLIGGKRSGTYFEPTVLTNTNQNMNVCCLEAFGPIVNIEKYDSFNLAVDAINNSDYGLQAGIFTDKQSEITYAFNNIEVGGLMINDVPTFRVDNMPYGGVKNSGLGREGVKYSIFEMLEPKLLVKNIL